MTDDEYAAVTDDSDARDTDDREHVQGSPENRAGRLLVCPIRGPLNSAALATDGLTVTEEARRIDLIKLLLRRGYPKRNIAVETVVLKRLGESGRNKLRVDLIVFNKAVVSLKSQRLAERLDHAIIVAEVKRDSKSKKSGIENQLEPALRLLPNLGAIGIYWDDVNQIIFTKTLSSEGDSTSITVREDDIANLPHFGVSYKAKPITLNSLTQSRNLMAVLFSIANVLRSHKINDEHTRYKETVKLILARYCDEREAVKHPKKELSLQIYPGTDPNFKSRVQKCYDIAAKRYSNVQTLFDPQRGPSISAAALRDIVRVIQGIELSKAPSEVMQQVFMSFVPAVFKKSMDQYFTPISLIEAMVDMVRIGPNDIIADPAMGTADFLTAALSARTAAGETDIVHRLRGADADPTAFDLAVVNMILHKDGQSGFVCEDSIQHHERWAGEIDVALCNPPFGENSVEKRPDVLEHYDLGHLWQRDEQSGAWVKIDQILPAQQLGLLFIEKCYKMLAYGGRMGIILPEGYLCTASYGYVRQWILSNLRILSLVELPRRIFTRSEADLRGNILIAKKVIPDDLSDLVAIDYPIHAELVRKVGFKMGKGFSTIPKRDEVTGVELRDADNNIIIDSDFDGVRERFARFTECSGWEHPVADQELDDAEWRGARVSDILTHANLDMKPRRLTVRALENIRGIRAGRHLRLGDIADVLEDTIDLTQPANFGRKWRLVEGIDIRAVEGVVVPQQPARAWQIVERKQKNVYQLQEGDIVVGLVRPERRNIGMLIEGGTDLVGSPDGIGVVRLRPGIARKYTAEWVFATLRSEKCRLQLWTESGGTSYGKLTRQHILDVVLPDVSAAESKEITGRVSGWAADIKAAFALWNTIGSEEDRRPIINSPMFGLEAEE